MPSLWENYGKPTLTPLEGRKIKVYKIVTGFPEDPVRSYIESENDNLNELNPYEIFSDFVKFIFCH